MKIKLKSMLETRWDALFYTKTALFKMKLEQSQPQIQGKMNRQQFHSYNGPWPPPWAARGSSSPLCLVSSLLPRPWQVSGSRDDFISSSLKVKCRAKLVKILLTSSNSNTQA